jgi:hypothetical protein
MASVVKFVIASVSERGAGRDFPRISDKSTKYLFPYPATEKVRWQARVPETELGFSGATLATAAGTLI